MAVLFTGDTHFGHGGARGLFKRPFATTQAMDEAMIHSWNEVVAIGDEVWHLGDFAVGRPAEWIEECLAKLHGTKHLIAGNNDKERTRGAAGWASVKDYHELELDGRLLILCHYPFRSWRRMDKGSVNLHGHCHGRLKPVTRQIDVGVDVWEFRPVTLEQLLTSRRTTSSGL